ncbi:hypothetical protein EIN_359820 [Entamoeba invadens IP1]|uniref:Uncharacterized protein n=1 Tax=Entamoeba invadens IP1 TaxID=370355 RepID=A0A0A1UDR0_ENTIV|nr:hypothetical protein EIN_359820 [Entamoeba invadens IP1]ELP90889.1 hypothetical protein EIN_359820 [Entamoeba invadens IP1]|eukprot:XP_004257660.1 hypothetical protein EIN_359820 [Entamoeba invadens IP1]
MDDQVMCAEMMKKDLPTLLQDDKDAITSVQKNMDSFIKLLETNYKKPAEVTDAVKHFQKNAESFTEEIEQISKSLSQANSTFKRVYDNLSPSRALLEEIANSEKNDCINEDAEKHNESE